MNNIPFNSTQNVINVARELNLTIPEAQMLIQRASQGARQGPLDMLIKPLSQQATNDAYRQLQSQVLRQAPNKNIPIGGMVKSLGRVAGPVMTIGVPVGQFVNETAQWNPTNLERYKQGVQIPQRGVGLAPNPYKDYYIEPSRRQ